MNAGMDPSGPPRVHPVRPGKSIQMGPRESQARHFATTSFLLLVAMASNLLVSCY